MRSFLLSALLLLSCEAFTTKNPDYCSDVRPCEGINLECDMNKHICIDKRTPQIDKISPFAVSRGGNVEVKIKGKGFTNADKVTVAGFDVKFRINNDNEISLVTPAVAGACGLTEVVIHTSDNLMTSDNKTLRFRAEDVMLSQKQLFGVLDPKIVSMTNVKIDRSRRDSLLVLDNATNPSINYYYPMDDYLFTIGTVGQPRTNIPLYKVLPARFFDNHPLDVLAIDQSKNYRVFKYVRSGAIGDPQPHYFAEAEVSAEIYHADAAVGNFDNNAGKLDRVAFLNAQNIPSTITIFGLSEKGDPELKNSLTIPNAIAVSSIVAGNLTDDDVADFVLTDKASGFVLILKNNISNVSILKSDVIANTNTRAQIIDLNGDNKQDVVVYGIGTTAGEAIVIYYNLGGDSFDKYVVNTNIGSAQQLGIADIDCDGLPDFLTKNDSYINWNSNLGNAFSLDRLKTQSYSPDIKSMVVGQYTAAGPPTIAFALSDGVMPPQYGLTFLLTTPQ